MAERSRSIDDGHALRFTRVRLAGIGRVRVSVSSAGPGGAIELRAGAPQGELLGRIEVAPNGAWERWFELETPLRDPGRPFDLVLRFVNPTSRSALFNLDWIEFLPHS